jgi:hypothetical protein
MQWCDGLGGEAADADRMPQIAGAVGTGSDGEMV